jgi:hypothetical protein
MKLPTIQKVEKTLGIKVGRWKGKCHLIATQLVDKKLIKGRAIYGHWLGPISRISFFKNRRGLPFVHHGWIETEGGEIVDPTRWVFEAVKPYIYFGKNDYYDEGGNKFRKAMERPCPAYNKKSKHLPFHIEGKGKEIEEASDYILELLNTTADKVTLDHAFWLGNLSITTLGKFALNVYQWLDSIGLEAIVPIDNWNLVMEV